MAQYTDKSLVEVRRDLHAHPEIGWTEFRTTALLAEALEERGYDIHLGADALSVEDRFGILEDEEIAAAVERARNEGVGETYLERMDGVTGLVAVKKFGDGAGPTVGVRVDVDALERTEARDDEHRPAREGFASNHRNAMHACGHDGHAAIGLGIAREFDDHGGFDGTLKLFFQPGEEGGKGGYPMSRTAHLEDVEFLFALHLGFGDTGTIAASLDRPYANEKLDVAFSGSAAHAGAYPEQGQNAVLAMATAIQNLYAIPRHSEGLTRVNVGKVHSGNPTNVVAEAASMRVEVRSESPAVAEHVRSAARRIVDGAATMHDVEVEVTPVGRASTFVGDEELVDVVQGTACDVDGVENVIARDDLGASEDASFLIRRVQKGGGQGTYVGIGSTKAGAPHTSRFDVDEDSLAIAVDVLTGSIRSL